MPDPARRLLSARTLRCFRDLLHKRTDTFLGKRQHELRRLPMPSAAEIAFVNMDGSLISISDVFCALLHPIGHSFLDLA